MEPNKLHNNANTRLAPIVKRRCANCGTERNVKEMIVCMDGRQMHRYVCDAHCMRDFYK